MKFKPTKIWQFAFLLAVLLAVDPFLHRLGEQKLGLTGMYVAAFTVAILFFILMNMWVNFVADKKNLEKTKTNVENGHGFFPSKQIKQIKIWQKIDKKIKFGLIALFFLIIAGSLVFYFFINPKKSEKIYEGCVAEVEKNPLLKKIPPTLPIKKNAIEACVKAGGAKNYSKQIDKRALNFPFNFGPIESKNKKQNGEER